MDTKEPSKTSAKCFGAPLDCPTLKRKVRRILSLSNFACCSSNSHKEPLVSSTNWLCERHFDGAVFSNENKASLGVIIRDSSSLALASCSEILSKAYTSNEVEAIAVAKALSFAKDLGFKKAVLEGDSLVVIKALLDEDGSLAPYGLLVEDAKILSRGGCTDLKRKYIYIYIYNITLLI
ncbi:hypothetical protein CFP56_026182 [Quercus suber]|uniref:RNase H type-1 domain-containing protein n=1 Tax=Quercus suber TaxID=58331 RepID=A0AAW0K1K9_QUESU